MSDDNLSNYWYIRAVVAERKVKILEALLGIMLGLTGGLALGAILKAIL